MKIFSLLYRIFAENVKNETPEAIGQAVNELCHF